MKNLNKKKKLYFLFGIYLESFYQAIAIYLSRHYGFTEFSGLMWGHNQLSSLDRRKVNWTHIEVMSDHIRTTLPSVKLDINYLKKVEEKYGIPNFGLMIHSDRWFGKKPYKWVLKFLQMSVKLIEQMYDETQPDVVIIDPIADLMSYLHYMIAIKRGIPCYSMTNSRVPDRISIDSGPNRLWKRVDQFFEERLHRSLTTKEFREAETFLEKFRQKKFRPLTLMGMQMHSTRDFFRYQYFLSFIRSMINWLRDPYNPISYRPHYLIINKISRLIRYAATCLLHYFEEPVSGEKYVLYPLHFEPEAATLISAPYFVDQLSLIENIARSLPVDYKLYVKEHFASVGRRPLSYYKRIRSLYNVRLIHPFSDSFQLVENAAAVATISSTMGWEALLVEKPVITFGQVCYNSYPLVIQARLQPIEKWPEIFSKVLKNNKSNNRELLLKYISASLNGTFPGIVGDSINFPQILEPENIKKVCDALVRVFKESEKKKY
jgi:hypothetical protein